MAGLGADVRPTYFIDPGPALTLLRADPDPDTQRALPYLDAASFLVAGEQRQGDEATGRLVVGLR